MMPHSHSELSPAEKLQLVEDLWDKHASKPGGAPVRDWQFEELERRKAHLECDLTERLSWKDIKQRVRSRLGR